MSRRQTTFWDRRGVLSGLPLSTLLLYYPRGQAALVIPRLPSSAVYERVRQPLRLQANQEPSGTFPWTTRLRLQSRYFARLQSRLDHRTSDAEEYNPTNDKNFSVLDPSGPERTVPLHDHGAAPTSPPGGGLQQLGLPLLGVWALTSSELHGQYRTAQPDALRHRRLRMTGPGPHAPQVADGLQPNRDYEPCAGHAGAARRIMKRYRRLWAQPGPRAVRGPRELRVDACTSRHCQPRDLVGTAGRERAGGAA
jgi:hypothetical protein